MYTAIGLLTTLASCLGFWILNKSLNINNLIIIPVPDKYAGLTRYKWRNVVGSLVHATVVSIVGAFCLYTTPQYLQDRVETHTSLGELNIAITVGYLIYDTRDLLQHQGVTSTWPILLHHLTLNIIGLHTFLYHQYLLGYGIICSLIEFNSVFLHGRQLLLMYSYSKSSGIYKINNVFNIFTYVGFRLAIFTTLFPFIWEDCGRVTPLLCNGFLLSATILLVINLVLFYRLIKSDFFSTNRKDDTDILVNNNIYNGKSK
ncbi:TLC domain-containing protein 2-like [Amphiura filiformis]|uniref:TLC domain-containing protein 2-like n=1 Tax=Amphiura filiformis TaxID=82378 RepID=UPI003B2128F6